MISAHTEMKLSMGGVFLRKCLKRAIFCILVALSLRLAGNLWGKSEAVTAETPVSFHSAAEDLTDGEAAVVYLRRIMPKMEKVWNLALEEWKNMFSKG